MTTKRRRADAKLAKLAVKRMPKHCDDYIDDPTQPAVLRAFLDRARMPAHGMLVKEPFPKLFADYKGQRVRVTMASRLGDVGIRFEFDKEDGYAERVLVSQLTNFSDTPPERT